jgi:hypothetical protein
MRNDLSDFADVGQKAIHILLVSFGRYNSVVRSRFMPGQKRNDTDDDRGRRRNPAEERIPIKLRERWRGLSCPIHFAASSA